MKATRIETSDFNPIIISIQIETPEEARALYAIFNNVHNTKLFKADKGLSEILSAIGRDFYIEYGGVIANGVTYEQYYHKVIP